MHPTIIISHSLIQMSADRHHVHMCTGVQISSCRDRWWKVRGSCFKFAPLLIGEKTMGGKLGKLRQRQLKHGESALISTQEGSDALASC